MEILVMPGSSVPASPHRFLDSPFDFHSHYTSAPTSPAQATAIYSHFNCTATEHSPFVPFGWEVTPGTPKSFNNIAAAESEEDELEFSFDLSRKFVKKQGMEPGISAAGQLFEGGEIRPLKLPPRLQYPSVNPCGSLAFSPHTPSSQGLRLPRSRRRKGEDGGEFDPFVAAMVETTRDLNSGSRKVSRSLSPLRGPSDFSKHSKLKTNSGKRWRLRDFLFRSVSEGRATDERNSLLFSSRNESFRSVDSGVLSVSRNEKRSVQRREKPEKKGNLFGCLRIDRICKRI